MVARLGVRPGPSEPPGDSTAGSQTEVCPAGPLRSPRRSPAGLSRHVIVCLYRRRRSRFALLVWLLLTSNGANPGHGRRPERRLAVVGPHKQVVVDAEVAGDRIGGPDSDATGVEPVHGRLGDGVAGVEQGCARQEELPRRAELGGGRPLGKRVGILEARVAGLSPAALADVNHGRRWMGTALPKPMYPWDTPLTLGACGEPTA